MATTTSNDKSPSPQELMRLCISLADQSAPKPTNFRVGAVLYSQASQRVLSTGYTLELPGNTHAEQCALAKFAASHSLPASKGENEEPLPEERVGDKLPKELDAVIYTSMEPCVKRLSGNMSCVQRILRTRDGKGNGVQKVYCAVREPDTFVEGNDATARLEREGVEVVVVEGFEEEARRVATAGHGQEG